MPTKKVSMNLCVLFRPAYNLMDVSVDDEYEICKKILTTTELRTTIPDKSIVIGRYSVLPYYRELEKDLKTKNCFLINSYAQHRYIADILNYYADIEPYTFKTYDNWADLYDGKYVLKGRTNSRKAQWDTHMFAEGRNQILQVAKRLLDDPFVADQGLVIREYVPLETFGEGINGLPVTNEHRLFYYREQLLSHGFYWSEHPEYAVKLEPEGLKFANTVAKIVAKRTNFFVLDIAKTQAGEWKVVELNDGQMSGLSENEPEVLYQNILKYVKEW